MCPRVFPRQEHELEDASSYDEGALTKSMERQSHQIRQVQHGARDEGWRMPYLTSVVGWRWHGIVSGTMLTFRTTPSSTGRMWPVNNRSKDVHGGDMLKLIKVIVEHSDKFVIDKVTSGEVRSTVGVLHVLMALICVYYPNPCIPYSAWG